MSIFIFILKTLNRSQQAEAENAPNLAAIRAMSNDATKFDTVLQMSTNALTQDTVEANVKRELAKLQATLGGIKSDLTGE